MGVIRKSSLILPLLSSLYFNNVNAEEYKEKVFVSGKPYIVTLNNDKYSVIPISDKSIMKKAVETTLVKYEIEEGYFKENFYLDYNRLKNKLILTGIESFKRSVSEAILAPIKNLEDPRFLMGSIKGILGKDVFNISKNSLNFAKGFLTTWWTNLPETTENRAVDPKLYVASYAKYKVTSFIDTIKRAETLLNNGFTYGEAMYIKPELYKIKKEMPSLVKLVDDVNNSRSEKLKVRKRDVNEFSILEWGGCGKNARISCEDRPRLYNLIQRVWDRIYETEEYQKYKRSLR